MSKSVKAIKTGMANIIPARIRTAVSLMKGVKSSLLRNQSGPRLGRLGGADRVVLMGLGYSRLGWMVIGLFHDKPVRRPNQPPGV
jgi:hypothetical protein